MSTSTDTPMQIHQGRNVRFFRERRGLKQDALADLLGEGWSQKKISVIESKETIDPALLEELASALNVSADTIKNFDEEKAIYFIQNNYEGANPNSSNVYGSHYNHCTINPLERYFEAVDKNEKLYEALLQAEREKNALLERLLNERR